MKKIGLAVFTVAAIASMSMSAFAGQWKDTAQGRRYMNDDGTYKKAELFQDETNGAYYLVDDNGYMVTGDMKFNGSSYSMMTARWPETWSFRTPAKPQLSMARS